MGFVLDGSSRKIRDVYVIRRWNNLPGPYGARPALRASPYIAHRGSALAQGVVQTCLLRLPQSIGMPVTILHPPPGGCCVGQIKSVVSVIDRNVHDGDDRREIEKQTHSRLLGYLSPLRSRPDRDGRSVARCKGRDVAPVISHRRDAEGLHPAGIAAAWCMPEVGSRSVAPSDARTFAAVCCSECPMQPVPRCGRPMKSRP